MPGTVIVEEPGDGVCYAVAFSLVALNSRALWESCGGG